MSERRFDTLHAGGRPAFVWGASTRPAARGEPTQTLEATRRSLAASGPGQQFLAAPEGSGSRSKRSLARAHNPEVAGSNPAPVTREGPAIAGPLFSDPAARAQHRQARQRVRVRGRRRPGRPPGKIRAGSFVQCSWRHASGSARRGAQPLATVRARNPEPRRRRAHVSRRRRRRHGFHEPVREDVPLAVEFRGGGPGVMVRR